jgi:hypothetical protein
MSEAVLIGISDAPVSEEILSVWEQIDPRKNEQRSRELVNRYIIR